jgi:hypothetical protein
MGGMLVAHGRGAQHTITIWSSALSDGRQVRTGMFRFSG